MVKLIVAPIDIPFQIRSIGKAGLVSILTGLMYGTDCQSDIQQGMGRVVRCIVAGGHCMVGSICCGIVGVAAVVFNIIIIVCWKLVTLVKDVIDQPIVIAGTADDKIGNFGPIERIGRDNEIILGIRGKQLALFVDGRDKLIECVTISEKMFFRCCCS